MKRTALALAIALASSAATASETLGQFKDWTAYGYSVAGQSYATAYTASDTGLGGGSIMAGMTPSLGNCNTWSLTFHEPSAHQHTNAYTDVIKLRIDKHPVVSYAVNMKVSDYSLDTEIHGNGTRDADIISQIEHGAVMRIQWPNGHVSRFSLAGSKAAMARARISCEIFSLPVQTAPVLTDAEYFN